MSRHHHFRCMSLDISRCDQTPYCQGSWVCLLMAVALLLPLLLSGCAGTPRPDTVAFPPLTVQPTNASRIGAFVWFELVSENVFLNGSNEMRTELAYMSASVQIELFKQGVITLVDVLQDWEEYCCKEHPEVQNASLMRC